MASSGFEQAKHNAVPMLGKRFGFLTVLEARKLKPKTWHWLVRCDCGTEKILDGRDLRKGSVKSCGCKRGQLQIETGNTHGMSTHPAYWVWRSMRDRCRLPSHQAWKNYGARGIQVCDRWNESFENFWADMGRSYLPGLTLERMNNSKGYNLKNCAWVDWKTQARNRRNAKMIATPWGRMNVSEASERSGIGGTTIHYRINHGWSDIDAVTTPPGQKSTTS